MRNTKLIIIFSINLQLASFDCFSTDPKLSDSAFWASKAIDLFAKKQYEESIITVDACFDIFTPEAVIMKQATAGSRRGGLGDLFHQNFFPVFYEIFLRIFQVEIFRFFFFPARPARAGPMAFSDRIKHFFQKKKSSFFHSNSPGTPPKPSYVPKKHPQTIKTNNIF